MENLTITIENNDATIFSGDMTSFEEDECFVLDMNTTFKRKNLKGSYREQIFETFKVGYGDLHILNPCNMTFSFEGHSIEMLFILEGSCLININGMPFCDCFEQNEHNIIYYTSTQGQLQVAKGKLSLFRINFSTDFLKQFLPQGKNFKAFRKQLKKNKIGKLSRNNYPITPNMHFIIKEIWHSKRVGFFRKIHMNAMVLELLLLQLDQSSISNHTSLKSDEEVKLLKVKDYITKHYTQPLTLKQLSKKFGTNDFALKKGFKAVFGTTVFRFIADLKMEKSKELLQEGCSISEVAETVGYKNPQHFSTAFKKRFGMTPSKFYL